MRIPALVIRLLGLIFVDGDTSRSVPACQANLVTLSGCRSGASEVAGADELLGLMRGFLYAGARSLLLSLWDVNDRSTSKFMGIFYQSWLGGMTKAEALQTAMQKMRAEEPHPYFWAPFVLIGNP